MCKRDDMYVNVAYTVAASSYANKKKVGALLVRDDRILAEGYNGTPKGFDNVCETNIYCRSLGYPMDDDELDQLTAEDFKPIGYKTLPEVLHAESNAITKIARSTESSVGATMYCTLAPCLSCAKLIIQSGITRLVYVESWKQDGLELLKKAKILVEQYKYPEK